MGNDRYAPDTSLRETCIKEISTQPHTKYWTLYTPPIQQLLESCIRASETPHKILLIVGNKTESALAQWLLENLRQMKRASPEEIFLTTVVIQAYRELQNGERIAQIITRNAQPEDIVLFFPQCSANKDLCEAAIATSETGAISFSLGAADLALPLEQYTDETVSVGRAHLSQIESEEHLFSLLTRIANAFISGVKPERPKGFFHAQAHTAFGIGEMNS